MLATRPWRPSEPSAAGRLCWVLFLVSQTRLSSAGPERRPPNIVMILADDLGFDDVSFRGGREFLTPNIDALAFHGKVLDRLYAPAMCTPSRAALMTGRYPIHTGTQHFVISNEEPWALPTNVTTLAEVFQEAGYSTNLVGKWHLGYARTEFTPTQRGFDHHYGYWGSYIDYYERRAKMPVPGFNLGYDFRRDMELECSRPGTYVTDLLTEEAERVIEGNNGTRPLFLLVSHLAAHTGNEAEPLQAPDEVVQRFGHIKDPRRRLYAGMVAKLDESVGRILRALERTDQLANAIVVFYSDNGAPSVGMFSNAGSNWPLRGQKNSPWEGGVRVAGAIWSPLLRGRGSVWCQPLYVGDWLPTLATAAGLALDPARHRLDGISLWAELADGLARCGGDAVEREVLHSLDDEWRVVSYMRGPWKYVNGSTLHGVYDSVLTLREAYDADPRDRRYATEVRNSPASRALRAYDEQRLTQKRVLRLRREAGVQCGSGVRRGCNALLEECLFNLAEDPCEQNNLRWAGPEHEAVLRGMRQQVEAFRSSAWPAGNRPGRPEFDPTRHGCAWTTFLEDPPAAEPVDCDRVAAPCERVD